MDFTVQQMWYGKAQAGLTPTSTSNRGEEERGVLVACLNWAV
jgi:hypothetical protein